MRICLQVWAKHKLADPAVRGFVRIIAQISKRTKILNFENLFTNFECAQILVSAFAC